MKRRALLRVPLFAAAPAAGRAQGMRRLPVVGFFGLASVEADRPGLEAFRRGLLEHGLVESRTIAIESRHADGDAARGAEIVRELVALPVDLFVVPGQAAARAIRRVSSIPVVAVALPPVPSDPELFASLARPGGTVTGFSAFGEEMSAKRIELLRELMPGAATVGILHNASDPTFDAWGGQTEKDARARGLAAIRVPIRTSAAEELGPRLRELWARGAPAVIVVRDFLTATLMRDIVRAASAAGVAVVAEQRDFAEAGALFSYGADMPDLFGSVGISVCRAVRCC